MRFLALSVFATILSAPAFAADLGTYRPGTPYNSSVAAGADVCDSQCAGDAQCRGWNYVKPNPQAPGICEYLSSVSTPISSQISISGENMSAMSYSDRLTAGGTNTVRVGTQVPASSKTVRVGQTPSTRRVVRHAPPARITTQSASTQPIVNMSLTEQQNRYRQAQTARPQISKQPSVRQVSRQAVPAQRQMFRPMLDASLPNSGMAPRATQPQQPQHYRPMQPPQTQQPQAQKPQAQKSRAKQKQASRRTTGPRRSAAQKAPQINRQSPAQYQQAPYSNTHPAAYRSNPQAPYARGGQSHPPVGQPIPTAQRAPVPQAPVRARPSTPSERLAQFTAQTKAATVPVTTPGPIALTPQQAQQSLFGGLNDDLQTPPANSSELPTASAVPTTPVAQQELGEVLAGGR